MDQQRRADDDWPECSLPQIAERTAPSRVLRGLDLRYHLLVHLIEADGADLAVGDLWSGAAGWGWVVPGVRPRKTISDALRWEVAKGRVVKVRRAVYRSGTMPKSTKSRIRSRVRRDRERLGTGASLTPTSAECVLPAGAGPQERWPIQA